MSKPISHSLGHGQRLARRQFAQILAGAAAFVALPHVASQVWAQTKPEKSKVAIAVAGRAAFYSLPLTIAEQLGFFRDEGLDVEISDFAGGTGSVQAVLSGGADVVSGAYEHTIHLQGKNQFFQAFVLQGRSPAIAMGFSTKTLANYKTWADLRNKRIGISAMGSSTHMLAKLVLAQADIKPEDVSFVGVGTSMGVITAMRSGQIDVVSTIDPMMTILEQKGDVRTIVDTRTMKGTLALFGGPMPASCLYAPSEFLQKNPNSAQALANGIVHALKWLQTAGPGDIIKAVPEPYFLGDRGMYLSAFNKVREALAIDGLVEDEGPRTALKALSSYDSSVVAAKISLPKTYTNEFARRAKLKFRA